MKLKFCKMNESDIQECVVLDNIQAIRVGISNDTLVFIADKWVKIETEGFTDVMLIIGTEIYKYRMDKHWQQNICGCLWANWN